MMGKNPSPTPPHKGEGLNPDARSVASLDTGGCGGFLLPHGEKCRALRGDEGALRQILRVRFGFAPLIRPFGPPSPRWGEETRSGRGAAHSVRVCVTKLVFVFALAFSAIPALAVQPDEILSNPVLEQRARDLSAQLRCMVCQNQSIDDSNAELARDLRVLVRERLVNGDSDEAVMDYVVSRYGEFVLLKPRLSARTMLLWGAPLLLIGAGVISIFVFSRRRAALPEGKKLSDEEEARIRDLIEK